MAEVKHTRGSWEADDGVVWTNVERRHMFDDLSADTYVYDGQCIVNTVFDLKGQTRTVEALANARLIAAEPDLFEAGTELQAARKAQKLAPSAENLSRIRRASDAFDAALSKATAQQEGR